MKSIEETNQVKIKYYLLKNSKFIIYFILKNESRNFKNFVNHLKYFFYNHKLIKFLNSNNYNIFNWAWKIFNKIKLTNLPLNTFFEKNNKINKNQIIRTIEKKLENYNLINDLDNSIYSVDFEDYYNLKKIDKKNYNLINKMKSKNNKIKLNKINKIKKTQNYLKLLSKTKNFINKDNIGVLKSKLLNLIDLLEK